MERDRRFEVLAEEVREMGRYAKAMQGHVHATKKADGSPVTEVDMVISKRMIERIEALFPDERIISEEHLTAEKKETQYTFVLDPIDGTDVYRQGFPSWAVSLGVLDSDKQPVGAFICAPRFGVAEEELFVSMAPGEPLLLNGKEFQRTQKERYPRQITIGSDTLKHVDISTYRGKLRCFGSSILHLLSPSLFSEIDGCVETKGYIWDVASSHAVLRRFGMDIVDKEGKPLLYDERLLSRQSYIPPIYAGTKETTDTLRELMPLCS